MATVRETVEEKRKKNKNNEEEKKTSLSVREAVEQKRNSSLSTNNTNKKPTFDYETGKKGWQKYLDDKANSDQQKANERENESFWDKLGRWLGPTGATDTTLPLGNAGQIIHDVRNDTSYTKPSDDWSEDQQYEFGALYLESPGKAYAYAEKINQENNKAKEEAEIKKIQDSATSNPWAGAAHTAGAIVSSPLGLADYLNMLVMANAGRDPSISDGIVSPFEYSQAVTEGVAADYNSVYGTLDESIPIIGGKGWGDVYGLGTSIAQSAISGYTQGPLGTLVSYFGQGAASGMKDALERGASTEQAALYGTALGAFEGVAEQIGIDNLFKLGSSSTIKGLLKNILNQAGAEGMEEGLTSIFSNIADNVIMQDKSNFYAMVAEYMKLGMSEEEAKKKAWMDSVEGIAYDTIAGAVSGGVHGGASTTIQTGISNYNTNKYFGNQAQDIVNDALNSPHANVQAIGQKYQEKLNGGKKLSGWNLNELIDVTDTDKIKNAALQRLGELGETSDVTAVAEVLVKQAMGEELSSRDQNILNQSKYGNLVATELNEDNIKSGGLANNWAAEIGTRKANPEVYNKAQIDAFKEVVSKAVTKESKYKVSEDGKTTLNDQEVSIQGVESVKGGEVTVRLESGETVNANDLKFSDKEALMYDIISRMDATPDTANKILSEVKPVSVAQASMYYNSIPLAYEYGKINYEAGLKNINLPKALKQNVYTRGRIDAMIQAEAKTPKTNVAQKGSNKTDSGIIYEDGFVYDEASANEMQRVSMAHIEVINKMSNLEVHVFESKVENGKRVAYVNGKLVSAPNGYFKDGNKIYIDFNAGNKGEGAMLYTMSHEITHYIREWNAKGFKELGDFLIEQYGKKGVNVEYLLEQQRKKIKKRYAAEGKALPSEAKLNDMAYEEMVADAMSDMLTDPKAYEKLAKLKQQNKTLWEKVGEAIKAVLDKLKAALGVYKERDVAVAEEATKARDFSSDVYDKLQDLYIKAFVEADANFEAASDGFVTEEYLNKTDILYNQRFEEDHKKKLEKEYSKDASIDLDTLIRRYNKILNIWKSLGGELNSKFLEEWNNKLGKDRAFTVFKAQAGYKYNVELSSMCKKGVPLFEAIDTIVKNEVMKQLNTDVLGKAEKEILYDILKSHNFEIPCAICYVEQARQREGAIIDAFLNGKIEKNKSGKITQYKLGWNEVLQEVQKEMQANGVDYTFAQVDRSISTDRYSPVDTTMDAATQEAFYEALKKIANKEIRRYNKAEDKNRKLVTTVTPSAIKEVFKGTLPSNLKIFKVLFNDPSSRFTLESDLLYSSMTTTNLAMAHNELYSLFNSQGGVSGYKTKQGAVVYWGDILGKTWEPAKVRDEGGIRNQSNSDFQMYTLLDQVQMYIDFSAKGYYLQAYTKVLSELKLFGLSRGKINASLIPAVHVYYNKDGSIDIETTRAYAGLDKNGNLFFDDIEGINHNEAFMLLEDAEYSKSIGGICIGYSDEHILKLLDDKRVQQIIGFHDKTDDPDKRYRGARYAKNYNGLNEAINNKDGKTVHIGFNPYVKKAEKMFKFNSDTETYEGKIVYNDKTYVADDIPKLAADLYLEMCRKKDYTPAYTDFDFHENYYKLLADFSLYDSEGHYAPHRKVAYNMPDSVPYLDINGKKKYMPTKDYIKAELEKELKVRDAIAEALADESENGIIPQFVKKVNEAKSETKLSDRDSAYMDAYFDGDDDLMQQLVDEAAREAGYTYKAYHRTENAFTKFDLSRARTNMDIQGFYFSADPYAESEYGSVRYDTYLKMENPYIVDSKESQKAIPFDMSKGNAGITARKWLQDNGYDGVIRKAEYFGAEADEYIVFDSNQIKSSEPMTFSDDEYGEGDIIPLSERFDADNNDIRYSDRDPYSYETLTSKPNMKLTTVNNVVQYKPTNSMRKSAVAAALTNAKSIGKTNSTGGVRVHVDDINSDVILSRKSLEHGLDRRFSENLPATLKAGEILKNAIRVNELTPKIKTAKAAYVLIGAAKSENGDLTIVEFVVNDFTNEVESIEVLKSINAKKEVAVLNAPPPTNNSLRITTSDISIAQLLEFVNRYFPDILPESVLRHFGYDARPEGELGENALYQERDPNATSNRTLLANALETAAQNDIERNKLQQYKSKIALIESEQKELNAIREEIDKIKYEPSLTDPETGKKMSIKAFQNKAKKLAPDQDIKFKLNRQTGKYSAYVDNRPLLVANKTFRDSETLNKLYDLQELATKVANNIAEYDRQLLNLESTTALKGVLQREKQMAYKKAQKEGREALQRQKEKDAETVRTLLTQHRESRQRATESRNKTAMKAKIKKVVHDLNKLLLNPTQDKHVPIGLQKVVAEALDAINMDSMNAEERVAYYNDLISKSSDPDEIAMLTKKRDFFEYRDMNFKERITELKNAYAEFKESDDPLIRNAHNDAIADLIKNTADEVGNKSLKDMSLSQLERVYDMYKAILATVRNANKMFKEGRQETVTENSDAVKLEVRSVGGHKDRVLKMTKFLKKFGWDMLKPVTALKVIGSTTFERLFNNVRAAEDTWAVDVNEAKQFFDDIAAKYGYNKWDLKKYYTFKDSAGTNISITLEQIMSLYAYSKRNQADKHLEDGGFVFDDAIEVIEKNKLGIPLKYEVNDANPYRLRKEHLLDITDALTKEQKDFVDAMQTYLSDVMGAKGNEVSLAMYDIKLYKEQNYFPLKTSRYFREFDPEKSATPKIKNSGFSKKTVPQAGNPIVLSNFMDVWAGHVNDMSMYHAFVLPLEDFMRVYNYSSTTGGYDSVQQYIKNAYGAQANQYIEKLMDDLNGGARVDSSAGIINKGLSLFKKASVFASASVVVQQPSAIARALAYINPKYFAKATPEALNIAKHKTLWAEVKKYAPVVVIKEMGYFDTGVGRSTVEWIKGNQTFKDKMDDVLSKAPAIADELCWVHIWEAVKRENAAKSKSKGGSEIFLMECGKRFTEVITNTQVYDSVLSRSGMMRSKDTGMKMATAFMAEPTTTVNMMVDGIVQGMRGNKKFTASTVGAISASIILNAILVSLVYAARDDDEDETYTEKYIGSVTSELLDGFNPLTYIPFVKDIWSIAQGYDVERSDMSVVSKLWESIESLFNENKSGLDKVLEVAGSVSSLFGIPLKNIIRDAKGMYNLTNTILSGTPTTGAGIKDAIEDSFKSSIPLWDRLHESDSKSDKLYDAIMSGDQNQIDRAKAKYKSEQAIETALKTALRENDSRIKEAAQARLDGNISKYTRIAREIIAEGHFSQDTVVAAINAEMNAIKKAQSEPTESTEDNDEATSIYKADDFNVAFDNGDKALALSIIDELIEMKVANGMDEAKSKSSLRSSMTSYWKPLYIAASKSGNSSEMQRIKQILYNSGLYGSAAEVVKAVNGWLK